MPPKIAIQERKMRVLVGVKGVVGYGFKMEIGIGHNEQVCCVGSV